MKKALLSLLLASAQILAFAQHAGYIHEFTDKNAQFTAVIRASRYKAVYGVWPDGSKTGPVIPKGLTPDQLKRLYGQAQMTKYLKWFRLIDRDAEGVHVPTQLGQKGRRVRHAFEAGGHDGEVRFR